MATIDYYLVPLSPFSYLEEIAGRAAPAGPMAAGAHADAVSGALRDFLAPDGG